VKVGAAVNVPELYQFDFSHYNEKARWALDYKRVPHRRRSLLPGPHVPLMLRLSGQKTVPVLRDGSQVVTGSARIIDYLEKAHPGPPLYPVETAPRERALEIQRWFDEEVGAQMRRAFFFETLRHPRYLSSLFCTQRSVLVQRLYTAVFPAIRLVMGREMDLSAAGAAAGCERTREALDFVVAHAGPEGYLVGQNFTVADLTAAAILAPAVLPPEFPVRIPEPRSPSLQNWLARWADHPGARWILETYRRHRGVSAAVA
jgi:glutathione S-transferase